MLSHRWWLHWPDVLLCSGRTPDLSPAVSDDSLQGLKKHVAFLDDSLQGRKKSIDISYDSLQGFKETV